MSTTDRSFLRASQSPSVSVASPAEGALLRFWAHSFLPVLAAVAIAILSGIVAGRSMPRGPVDSREALILLVGSLLVGFGAGIRDALCLGDRACSCAEPGGLRARSAWPARSFGRCHPPGRHVWHHRPARRPWRLPTGRAAATGDWRGIRSPGCQMGHDQNLGERAGTPEGPIRARCHPGCGHDRGDWPRHLARAPCQRSRRNRCGRTRDRRQHCRANRC